MVDEEFYFEESNPKKVFLICLLILFLIGAGFGAYQYFVTRDNIKLKQLKIELGDKVPDDISTYIKSGKYEGYTLDVTSVHVDDAGNTDSTGEYSYKIIKESLVIKGKIIVQDTTAPVAELQELTVGLNEDFDVNDFLTLCEDLSGACYVSYANSKEEEYIKEEGIHEISLKIKDKYNNEIIKKTKLIVSKDASLRDLKASDQTVANIYPVDDEWDKTFTVKFAKGISEEDETFDEKIFEITNREFDKEFEEKIVNQTLLTIYNKYNYILGFSIKLEFEDGKTIYVTS